MKFLKASILKNICKRLHGPNIQCPDSCIIWDKLEIRKTKQHEILEPNATSAGTIPNGATKADSGCGKKWLRHDAYHLSSQ